jgi:hypothetical protein
MASKAGAAPLVPSRAAPSLENWLQGIDANYTPAVLQCCNDQNVDIAAMMGLNDAQLKELGFLMGDRSKILQSHASATEHGEFRVFACHCYRILSHLRFCRGARCCTGKA